VKEIARFYRIKVGNVYRILWRQGVPTGPRSAELIDRERATLVETKVSATKAKKAKTCPKARPLAPARSKPAAAALAVKDTPKTSTQSATALKVLQAVMETQAVKPAALPALLGRIVLALQD